MQTRKGEEMFGNKILNAYSPGGHRQGLIYVGAPSGNYIERGGLVLLDRSNQAAHDGVNGHNVRLILDRTNGNYIQIRNIGYLPINGVTLTGDWYPICFIDASVNININGKVIATSDFPIINEPKIKTTKEYVKLYAVDGSYTERLYYIIYFNISGYQTVILTDRSGNQYNYIYVTDDPIFNIPVDNRKFEIYSDKPTPFTYEMGSKMFYDEYYDNTQSVYAGLKYRYGSALDVLFQKEINTATFDVKFKYNTEISVRGYPDTYYSNKTGVLHIETEDSFLSYSNGYLIPKMFLFTPAVGVSLLGDYPYTMLDGDITTSSYYPYRQYITYREEDADEIYFDVEYGQAYWGRDNTVFNRVQGSLFDLQRGTPHNRSYEGPQLIMSNLSYAAASTLNFAIGIPYSPTYPYSKVIPPTHWALYNGEVHTI